MSLIVYRFDGWDAALGFAPKARQKVVRTTC